MRVPGFLVLIAAAAGCSHASLAPVPVKGTNEELVGEWSGDYSTRRPAGGAATSSGSRPARTRRMEMSFSLRIMPPPPRRRSMSPGGNPGSQVIRISIVRCAQDEVTG